ncbi:MAG: hypothetical protein AAF703_04495 [Cyanobacteria bacterium P01_D01_bin.105]
MDTSSEIRAAVDFIQTGGQAPHPPDVVAALLSAEKESKRHKQRYAYEDLLGAWQLGFVSGTQTKKTSGKKPMKTVGNGRFVPGFVAIAITYQQDAVSNTVINAVTLGPLNLTLTGPTRFWPKTNSLAFDFTTLQIKLGDLSLYDGSIRGGRERAQTFKAQSLKDQAFFTFFTVAPDHIAARGKGGGLALWTRKPG